eukprot:836912-Prorocentrum_minimum.AAC.1
MRRSPHRNYLEGRRGVLSADFWVSQVGIGLQHLHWLNIAHRDLKAANIFITDTGIVKVRTGFS